MPHQILDVVSQVPLLRVSEDNHLLSVFFTSNAWRDRSRGYFLCVFTKKTNVCLQTNKRVFHKNKYVFTFNAWADSRRGWGANTWGDRSRAYFLCIDCALCVCVCVTKSECVFNKQTNVCFTNKQMRVCLQRLMSWQSSRLGRQHLDNIWSHVEVSLRHHFVKVRRPNRSRIHCNLGWACRGLGSDTRPHCWQGCVARGVLYHGFGPGNRRNARLLQVFALGTQC